jgi:DNA-binding NarL/FixJ family response regulator
MVILDIGMPQMDGYDTAKWLYKHHPGTRIIVLTMLDSEMMIVQQIRAGVKGFLKKDVSPVEFRTAIYTVMENIFYFSPDVIKTLLNQAQLNSLMASTIVNKELTEREIEFLRYTCSDHTYKEIAEMMNLGPRIVDRIRDDLFERLDIKSRVGLAIFAMRQGLVAL